MKRAEGKKIALTLILLACGIVLVAAGILRGEAQTVLDKAIRICTECMGLG